jgi:hypothetical protein
VTKATPASETDNETESLGDDASKTLDEARMVLPGMQALFGFQLIAVFNQGFRELGTLPKYAHLAALLLVTVGIALIMAPAIFHRIAERGRISRRFIQLASQLIAWAMVPLALGLTLDVMLVTWLISESRAIVAAVGMVAFALFGGLWFAFPLTERRRRHRGGA